MLVWNLSPLWRYIGLSEMKCPATHCINHALVSSLFFFFPMSVLSFERIYCGNIWCVFKILTWSCRSPPFIFCFPSPASFHSDCHTACQQCSWHYRKWRYLNFFLSCYTTMLPIFIVKHSSRTSLIYTDQQSCGRDWVLQISMFTSKHENARGVYHKISVGYWRW